MQRALMITGFIVVLTVAGFFGFHQYQRMQASAASFGATGMEQSNQSVAGGDVKEGDVLGLNPPVQSQPPGGGGGARPGQ